MRPPSSDTKWIACLLNRMHAGKLLTKSCSSDNAESETMQRVCYIHCRAFGPFQAVKRNSNGLVHKRCILPMNTVLVSVPETGKFEVTNSDHLPSGCSSTVLLEALGVEEGLAASSDSSPILSLCP